MTKKLLLFIAALVLNSVAAQNNYLDFDGIDDVVQTTNATATVLANGSALTLSCKVYPTRVSSGFPDFNGFCGYRNESDFDFYLIQLSSTDVEARFRNSAGVAYTITYTGLTLNQWSQFFLVYNGSTLKLYNGTTEVGSVPAFGTVPSAPTGTLEIGRIVYQAFNWYHKGYIDEVSVWNKALQPADMSAIVSNAGEIATPASEANLKLYYKFNQGVAYGDNAGIMTLTDTMGAANGLLSGFALTGSSSNWGGQPLSNAQFDENHLAVFPNPAHDFISVGGVPELTSVEIYDTAGRNVGKQIFEPGSVIDISKLSSGIYLLVLNHTNRMKFIKD